MISIKYIKEKTEGLRRFFPLLKELVIRDIKVRYRHSFLGLVWTILNPLMMMVVITVVFSTLFKSNIPYFPIYYLSGSLIFSFNAESTTIALNSMVSNAALIKKVYIPKYLFPLSNILSCLVNFGVSLIAMFIVMIIIGAPFYSTLLLIPIPVFYTFLFTTGLSLILAAYTVYFRDIAHFYGVFVLAWTYFTPIFYPTDILNETVMSIMRFNPMYHFVSYMRSIVLYGTFPSMKENIVCILIGIVFLISGLFVFYKKQDRFVLFV